MSVYDVDTNKIVNKVYHIDEMHDILEDVITDYVNQAVLMSDEELKEDRSEWIKTYGREEEGQAEKETLYDTAIHTLAIEIEQLRRMGKIYYGNSKQITEKINIANNN